MGEHQSVYSAILGKIAGLFREFNKLAAQQGVSAQALTKALPAAVKSKAPGAHEGMLGSLILEQLITPVFAHVAAHFIIDTPQGSVTGAVTAVDIMQNADAFDETLSDTLRRASDDARFKKGAGKGTEALILGNTKPAHPLAFPKDKGRGFFTSPFNSRAQKRLESALIDASQQIMNLERFGAQPA
ncbi:MAG: hypothetical protein LRY54_01205 [Alphaproteobacteria bacterium]|nr:hypothetical protein [Alphaproteobacteria bacterium]